MNVKVPSVFTVVEVVMSWVAILVEVPTRIVMSVPGAATVPPLPLTTALLLVIDGKTTEEVNEPPPYEVFGKENVPIKSKHEIQIPIKNEV